MTANLRDLLGAELSLPYPFQRANKSIKLAIHCGFYVCGKNLTTLIGTLKGTAYLKRAEFFYKVMDWRPDLASKISVADRLIINSAKLPISTV